MCPMEDCKSKFTDIVLNHQKLWTAKRQRDFHLENNCAKFNFESVNYAYFRPMVKEHLGIQPIPGLDVGNVLFVYAGESENSGLMRALCQVFRLHANYALKLAGKAHDEYLAQVYERTLGKKCGLYLMLVRDGDTSRYDEIKTSEYNSKRVNLRNH